MKAGATVRNVIADKNVVFSANTSMMGHEHYPVVVAKNSVI